LTYVLEIARPLSLGLIVLVGASAAPSRSPSGKLAVEATRNTWRDGSPVESGGENYPTDIYVVDVAQRRIRNLTRDERTEYCWSWLSGAQAIVFASVPSDRMKRGPTHIDVVNADGTRRHRVASGTGFLCPTLAPDGRRILFVAEGARQRGLWIMQADGTRKKRLTRSHESPYEASWSPNGEWIVFVRELPRSRSDIFVINADGTGLHRLTRTEAAESEPAWSPDGQRIAFIRGAGPWGLPFTMRRDGTSVKRLAPTGHNGSPGWLASARVFYWDADDEKWWSVDAEGSEKRRPLAAGTRVGDQLFDRKRQRFETLSPDGVWVAFDTYGPRGGRRIWVAHTDGTHRQLVAPKICACFRLALDWAPK
jgi:TolB protein